jgi:hypothetical protein
MTSPGEWRDEEKLLFTSKVPGDDQVGVPDLITEVWLHWPSRQVRIVQRCEPDYFDAGPDEIRFMSLQDLVFLGHTCASERDRADAGPGSAPPLADPARAG